jgi:hypothetical protein
MVKKRHLARVLGLFTLIAAMFFGVGAATAQTPGAGATGADTRAAIARMTPGQSQELRHEVQTQLAKKPGGVQLSANEIEWGNGKVVLSFPIPGTKDVPADSSALIAFRAKMNGKTLSADSVTPMDTTVHGCPKGTVVRWYCFYQDKNWGGRRLQWSDPHCDSDDFLDFNNYGFEDETSSWVNTGWLTVYVYDYAVDNIWTEASNSSSSYVGSFYNDTAWYAEAC